MRIEILTPSLQKSFRNVMKMMPKIIIFTIRQVAAYALQESAGIVSTGLN